MKTKNCRECFTPIGANSRTLLCEKDREKKWVIENRSKSNKIKKVYVKNHPQERYKTLIKYKQNNRQRVNAWAVLKYHVDNGDIKKQLYCEMCTIKESVHAHHPDISRPLFVVWVCNSCHKQAHGYDNQLHYAA